MKVARLDKPVTNYGTKWDAQLDFLRRCLYYLQVEDIALSLASSYSFSHSQRLNLARCGLEKRMLFDNTIMIMGPKLLWLVNTNNLKAKGLLIN